MLNISLPHIVVQRVTNGWLVQWQASIKNPKDANKTKYLEAVCLLEHELILVIKKASDDVADISQL